MKTYEASPARDTGWASWLSCRRRKMTGAVTSLVLALAGCSSSEVGTPLPVRSLPQVDAAELCSDADFMDTAKQLFSGQRNLACDPVTEGIAFLYEMPRSDNDVVEEVRLVVRQTDDTIEALNDRPETECTPVQCISRTGRFGMVVYREEVPGFTVMANYIDTEEVGAAERGLLLQVVQRAIDLS